MTANAVAAAARNVRVKALEMAGMLLQAEPGQLDILDGRIVSKNAPSGPSIDLGSIAQALKPSSKVRGNMSPGLCSDGWFDTEDQVYPYGNQFATVSVDRETGAVKVEKYLIAYDVGRAVNPKLVSGQLVGGFAQGLGGALYEEFIYNESGEPLSVSFADYLLPTCSEVPQVEVLLTEDYPTPRNPLGIKGAGEGGIAPVGAVIASAIEDALQRAGAITEIPLSPQKVKRLMEDNNVALQYVKK
jgi:carbon-monoxide dehydrogenase large subunit/6-hydroxypseudooxynicotine dehydrogenase subunit gamma